MDKFSAIPQLLGPQNSLRMMPQSHSRRVTCTKTPLKIVGHAHHHCLNLLPPHPQTHSGILHIRGSLVRPLYEARSRSSTLGYLYNACGLVVTHLECRFFPVQTQSSPRFQSTCCILIGQWRTQCFLGREFRNPCGARWTSAKTFVRRVTDER